VDIYNPNELEGQKYPPSFPSCPRRRKISL